MLKEVRDTDEFGKRMERLSARLLDAPYLSNPLGGGPDAPESLGIRFDGFDCVTYVETVLALAGSRTVEEFGDALREMRYADGKVDWRNRNHYMADWVKQNRRRGIVKDMTNGPRAVTRTRRLSLIRELPARTVTFRVFPKRALAHLRRVAATGDIALFASTRRNLDVFHMGFIIKRGDDVWLRHASRSAGRVVEQPLADFLKAQRMSGIILLRPLCQP
ncbi:MAG TPA: N-acetylmuramoyl-L-alanine amidase-like domain-containing protein [Blastocatellia bacterium]|nr:N-acetylmuramoyl-L-alanine amidase-like domain-containing protein [Blastocatellia bacterium]